MKDFSSWPFLCLCVLCDTHARLLFERASEQESCLFFLFDPGVLLGNAAFSETVAYPSQMLSDFSSDIFLRTIETSFEIINDFAPSAIRTLSYHRLPFLEVRMTFVTD